MGKESTRGRSQERVSLKQLTAQRKVILQDVNEHDTSVAETDITFEPDETMSSVVDNNSTTLETTVEVLNENITTEEFSDAV